MAERIVNIPVGEKTMRIRQTDDGSVCVWVNDSVRLHADKQTARALFEGLADLLEVRIDGAPICRECGLTEAGCKGEGGHPRPQEAPPAQERNPEGEVLRTHRVKGYHVGTTGRLYSARVREEYPGAWSALVTCTHLDSFGRATVSMGGSPTVVCRTVGTYPGKARAEREALEALNLHTVNMGYTVEEPEDSAIVRPISE